ncbi:aminotransferase, partial [Enterococcus faecium]
FYILDDVKFVLDLLHEHHILLVLGGGFNWNQPDHFRIVYLTKMDDLKQTSK